MTEGSATRLRHFVDRPTATPAEQSYEAFDFVYRARTISANLEEHELCPRDGELAFVLYRLAVTRRIALLGASMGDAYDDLREHMESVGPVSVLERLVELWPTFATCIAAGESERFGQPALMRWRMPDLGAAAWVVAMQSRSAVGQPLPMPDSHVDCMELLRTSIVLIREWMTKELPAICGRSSPAAEAGERSPTSREPWLR